MANEIVQLTRNVGTTENPIWENWFPAVVADAIRMSLDPNDASNNVNLIDYVDKKVTQLKNDIVGGATAAYDTFKELEDYINQHGDVADALNDSLVNKVDKIEGKGLSANDFTDDYKDKVDNMSGNSEIYLSGSTNSVGGAIGNFTTGGTFTNKKALDLILNEKGVTLKEFNGYVVLTDVAGNRTKVSVSNDIILNVSRLATIDFSHMNIKIDFGSYTDVSSYAVMMESGTIMAGNITPSGVTKIDLSGATGFNPTPGGDNHSLFIYTRCKIPGRNETEGDIYLHLCDVNITSQCVLAFRDTDSDTIEQKLNDGYYAGERTALAACTMTEGATMTLNSFEYGYLILSNVGDAKNIIDQNGFDITNMFRAISYNSDKKAFVSKFPIEFNKVSVSDNNVLSFTFKY